MSSLMVAAYVLSALPGVSIPDPVPVQPPGFDGFTTLTGWVFFICLSIAVLSLLVLGAAYMVPNIERLGIEPTQGFLKVIVGIIIASSAGTLVTGVLGIF